MGEVHRSKGFLCGKSGKGLVGKPTLVSFALMKDITRAEAH